MKTGLRDVEDLDNALHLLWGVMVRWESRDWDLSGMYKRLQTIYWKAQYLRDLSHEHLDLNVKYEDED